MAFSSGIQFHIADYLIFALLLCASLVIGIYSACAGGGQRTKEAYLHGNRKLHLLPVMMSFVASFLSAIVLLGQPAEAYYYGLQIGLQNVTMTLVCFPLAFLFVPVIYPLQLTSMFEYLELRFKSPVTRLVGTTINLMSEISWAGLALFAPALCLQAVMSIPVWISMVVMATLSTIYTSIGGIKAVVWTDVLQTLVMLATLLAVIVMGTVKVGGIFPVADQLLRGNRLDIDLDPDPTKRMTLWIILVGNTSFSMAMYFSQAAIQRMSSLPTIKQAKLMYLLSPFGFIIINLLSLFAGSVVYAYYGSKLCDPLAAGYITNSNQILPYFVADVMQYPGINGLFVACIFSAVLSTVSSIQNSVAATLWEDFFKWKLDSLKEGTKMLIIKALVVLTGFLSIALGLCASTFGGTLIQVSAAFIGAAIGPRLAMFVLGAGFPVVGAKACSISAIIGVSVCIAFSVLNIMHPARWPRLPTSTDNCSLSNNSWTMAPWLHNKTNVETSTVSLYDITESGHTRSFYHLSSFYYALLGFITTMISAFLFTLVPAFRNKNPVDPRYLFHCSRKSGSKLIRDGPPTPDVNDTEDKEAMLQSQKDVPEKEKTLTSSL